MATNFRALCAELVNELAAWQQADDLYSDGGTIRGDADHDLVTRARAALDEPEGEWPSREEVLAALRPLYGDQTAADMGAEDDLRTAHVILARWGHSAPQAPMSEEMQGLVINPAELVQLACGEKLGRLNEDGRIMTRYYYPKDIGENVIAFAHAVLGRWGCSGTLLQQQADELAALRVNGWVSAMTNLVDQIGGGGPSLSEWGATVPTPEKVAEYLREHIEYLEQAATSRGVRLGARQPE
jgi:hypothetical protein